MRKDNFDDLVDLHHKRLYWLIRNLVTTHENAEDVAQNTWMKIYKGLPNFRGESKIETWMFRIGYNEAMRFLKKQKPKYSLTELDTDYLQVLTADPHIEFNKLTQEFHLALSRLKPQERHLFQMKYFNELTFKAIASVVQLNENTVKTIYYKAEKKIKLHLSKLD